MPVYLRRTPTCPVKHSDPTHRMDSAVQALRRGDWPHACPRSELNHIGWRTSGYSDRNAFRGHQMLHGTTETTLPAKVGPRSVGYRQHQSGKEVSRAGVPLRPIQALRMGSGQVRVTEQAPNGPIQGVGAGDYGPLQGTRGTSVQETLRHMPCPAPPPPALL